MGKTEFLQKRGISLTEPLIFSRSSTKTTAIDFFNDKIDYEEVKKTLQNLFYNRQDLLLPELNEPQVVRHYTKLSQKNFSIDTTSYPLGSCTMKYNPKINEWVARLPGLCSLHPLMPIEVLQPALEICYQMQTWLSEIGGFVQTSLAPSAGAHGEFAGLAMISKALKERKEHRTKIMVPTSAHGTNPATAAFFGWEVLSIEINTDGRVNLSQIESLMDEKCVGIMITNPNTLGIFESDLAKISHIIHNKGGYVYGDGANLNALLGICRPGDCGVDVMHFNLHKTFTTPHGGGGPGCGALGASEKLYKYLPTPLIKKTNELYEVIDSDKDSIGRIRSFFSNFGLLVRAWTYLQSLGPDGLKQVSQRAVLNANYIRHCLKDHYHLAFQSDCLHEVVLSDKWQQDYGISALDISKRLIDYGIHPPTMYFPLIVRGALMIEPTETESLFDLDHLINAFISVAKECKENPKLVKSAPHTTALSRIDEVKAVRELRLSY
jgi:glycine dehydrogenase subunit 2